MRRWLLLILAVAIAFAVADAGQRAAASPSHRPSYRLDVRLDYQSASLTADESVFFTNRTEDILTGLVFKVIPAYFGGFSLVSAQADGTVVEAHLDRTVLEVPLHNSLKPGQSTEVALHFKLDVPRQGGRYGVNKGIIALGNWFPILAVYRDPRLATGEVPPGWDRQQYIEIGDAFFSEAADFEVTVASSDPSIAIAHSGYQVFRDDSRWRFQARSIRDFAMTISTRYQVRSKQAGPVLITSYVLPEDGPAAGPYLDLASRMASWLGERVKDYPLQELAIAEVGGESSGLFGQEYPGLVFISGNVAPDPGLGSFMAYLVLHEVAHQWFYGIVGNDQFYQPWLDEAMATWLSYRYIASQDPGLYSQIWDSRIKNFRENVAPACAALPVDSSLLDFSDEGCYFGVVYSKGAMLLDDLYQTMGDADFFGALQTYQSLLADGLATPGALLKTLQAYTTQQISPIASRYLRAVPELRSLGQRVSWPQAGRWSGEVMLPVSTDLPLATVRASLDGAEVPASLQGGSIVLATSAWPDGFHSLTLSLTDALGYTGQESSVVASYNAPPPTATPSPAPTPELTPPNATPVTPPSQRQLTRSNGRLPAGIVIVALALVAISSLAISARRR